MKLKCPNCRKIAAYPRDRELYKKCKCQECGASFPALSAIYYQSDSELLLDVLHIVTRIEEKIDKFCG